jgi:hypothetical protein
MISDDSSRVLLFYFLRRLYLPIPHYTYLLTQHRIYLLTLPY